MSLSKTNPLSLFLNLNRIQQLKTKAQSHNSNNSLKLIISNLNMSIIRSNPRNSRYNSLYNSLSNNLSQSNKSNSLPNMLSLLNQFSNLSNRFISQCKRFSIMSQRRMKILISFRRDGIEVWNLRCKMFKKMLRELQKIRTKQFRQ
mgnify:CR=1 FL=1